LLIYSQNGVEFLLVQKGIVLGAFEEMPYHTHHVTLKPGDSIFLYTDGVTEATNVDQELYSEARLKESILELHDRPVEEISRQMIERLEGFAQGAPQSDDITMMILQYKGAAS
jgi:sigma-B regulation protein RsbU (phosphoserine phosphatase)